MCGLLTVILCYCGPAVELSTVRKLLNSLTRVFEGHFGQKNRQTTAKYTSQAISKNMRLCVLLRQRRYETDDVTPRHLTKKNFSCDC